MADYIPNKGDLIYVNFNPQAGHEQKGRRPSLVVSNRLFNRTTNFALTCPITNTNRRRRTQPELPESSSLSGFVMTEQLKSIDYKARGAEFVEALADSSLQNVLAIIKTFID